MANCFVGRTPPDKHIVARTPSKLTGLMLAANIPQSTLDTRLNIVQGDARDLATVTATVTPPFLSTVSPGSPVVDIIISGIGTPPKLSTNLDWTVCEGLAKTLVSALRSLSYTPQQAPYLTCLSTTGITDVARDVPLLLMPLYHIALKSPHKDKRAMEAAFESINDGKTLSGFTVVRPTLLTDGKETTSEIKAGTEKKPAMGYTISRRDVGKWMYHNMIDGNGRSIYKGEKVSLAYA